MKRPIHPGLSPNLEKEDALLALSTIFKPIIWKKGKYILALELWFERFFKGYKATSFISGRGALFTILRALGIKKGDEVLLQAFTCAAVPQAIIAAGAMPIYVDIDETLTMDSNEYIKKITPRTKAIIFQYTFGNPGNIEKIRRIAKEKNIFLIEDCAHFLGTEYKNKKLGTFGDAALFSFGRDKAFSSVTGGMGITKDILLSKKIDDFQKRQEFPTYFSLFQQLFHSVVMYYCILPFYDFFKIGKAILVLLQKLHMLSKPVSVHFDKTFSQDLKKMPNALSALALLQVKKIERFNKKRISIAKQYESLCKELGLKVVLDGKLPYLRYPLLVENQTYAKKFFRKRGIYLGDWYSNCIDPKGTELGEISYRIGMCPQAEDIAQHIINLPMYPTMTDKDVKKVMKVLKAYANNSTNNK